VSHALVAEQRHCRVVAERDMTGDHRPGDAVGLIETQAGRRTLQAIVRDRAVPVS
jgi:hypothetical protein